MLKASRMKTREEVMDGGDDDDNDGVIIRG